MNTTDALTRALSLYGPSPCDKFRCDLQARCATGQACAAFSVYLRTGRAIHPASVIVIRTGGRLHVDGLNPQGPQPSAKIFGRLFSRVDAPFHGHRNQEIVDAIS